MKRKAMLVCCMTMLAKSADMTSSRLTSGVSPKRLPLLMAVTFSLFANFRHQKMNEMLQSGNHFHGLQNRLTFDRARQQCAGNKIGHLIRVFQFFEVLDHLLDR